MAGRTQTLSYKIVIEGQQARDEAKKMEGQMTDATAKVEELKKQLEQARVAGAEASVISGLEKSLDDEQKNLKTLNKLWKERVCRLTVTTSRCVICRSWNTINSPVCRHL